jgi:hypothetical protein
MVDLTPEGLNSFVQSIPWKCQPLTRELSPEDYPIDRLPPVIGEAVQEVQAYVQAPMALVAACALAVVSAAVQSRFNVRRDAVLSGPSSLYFMTVAETGERKSAIDKLFMAPLTEWQSKQLRKYREEKAEYETALEAWEQAKQNLIIIPERGIDPRMLHEASKPQEPRKAKMLRGEDTTEALLIAMQDYPIAAILSAEAGLIFGGHSMGGEKAMATLATWNQMWDSATIEQGRVGRDPIHIENPRATLGLMIQPAVLRNFMQKSGDLATGMGFFARCLFSQPTSTQGERYYIPPAGDMPALRTFRDRVTALLDVPVNFDVLDRLDPDELLLDHEAQACWIAFHDEVEEQLGGRDVFATIKGVASKAAENAARLACCYHVFETGGSTPIPFLTMDRACAAMRWYLDEAVRFNQVAEQSEEVRLAQLLEAWIVERVKASKGALLTVAMVQRLGPNPLRARPKLDAALELLDDHGRIRVRPFPGNKKKWIEVAPAVMLEYS